MNKISEEENQWEEEEKPVEKDGLFHNEPKNEI